MSLPSVYGDAYSAPERGYSISSAAHFGQRISWVIPLATAVQSGSGVR